MSLSVVVSTYNRQDKLRTCLESIQEIADEIIVVDNSSSDESVSIAKKYTKHVYIRKNNPMLNINKNFGISKATKDWILYLDDDETLSPELTQEIRSMINNQSSMVNGYWIPRKNIIFGKWIQHTGWYPDYQMRLFRNGKGKYKEVHVHEMIQVDGPTEKLHNAIEHSNYESIEEFVKKTILIYAPNEAKVLLENGYKFSPMDSILMPAKEFIRRFFANEGYKDGLHGFVLSLLMAFYHLLVFGYLWEYEKFQQIPSNEFMPNLSSCVKELKKEFFFWTYTTRIHSTKNPLKKFLLRIKRKFL